MAQAVEEQFELIAGETDLLLQRRIVDNAEQGRVGIETGGFGAALRFLA
jgi:hypothetical protein